MVLFLCSRGLRLTFGVIFFLQCNLVPIHLLCVIIFKYIIYPILQLYTYYFLHCFLNQLRLERKYTIILSFIIIYINYFSLYSFFVWVDSYYSLSAWRTLVFFWKGALLATHSVSFCYLETSLFHLHFWKIILMNFDSWLTGLFFFSQYIKYVIPLPFSFIVFGKKVSY